MLGTTRMSFKRFTRSHVEGVRSLQKGLVPGIWFQIFMNGPRLGIYQTLDNYGFLRRRRPDASCTGGDDLNKVVFHRSVIAAAFSGVVGALLGSPFYMVKTQLQAQSAQSISVGYQHEHTSMSRALMDIVRTRGFMALWTGACTAVPRVMVGSSIQLSTFSHAKQLIEKQNFSQQLSPIGRTFFASLVSGVVVVIFMTPFDVVATRIFNQPVGVALDGSPAPRMYSGFFNCAFKIAKTEGFWGFYKGFGPVFFRLTPHTVLCLIFWDQFRRVGAKTNLL